MWTNPHIWESGTISAQHLYFRAEQDSFHHHRQYYGPVGCSPSLIQCFTGAITQLQMFTLANQRVIFLNHIYAFIHFHFRNCSTYKLHAELHPTTFYSGFFMQQLPTLLNPSSFMLLTMTTHVEDGFYYFVHCVMLHTAECVFFVNIQNRVYNNNCVCCTRLSCVFITERVTKD